MELLVQEKGQTRSARNPLHGIDAPESNQPFGQASKKWLSVRVFKKAIAAEVRDTDRYGRTVAVLKVGGRDVNVESVRAGMSWWYRQFARRDSALERAETEARTAKRGLWSEPGAIAPWEFHRGWKFPTSTVERGTAHPDGSGRGAVRSAGGHRPPPSVLVTTRTAYGYGHGHEVPHRWLPVSAPEPNPDEARGSQEAIRRLQRLRGRLGKGRHGPACFL